ncbi:dipeptide ABC transporter ATP-binding protein [Herbidospora yilanensis]|uniref:dipeptide ABC transporter ATP-binding protein n=1 Tax=Herbidospora yilanensis TaxID=354426 RepID=UPI0007825F9F|nr:ABC transporter ATP-binding protein [Herbidospora yilanensis]
MIAVDGLSVAYQGVEIVREVSFTVAPGRTYGLVGESGSGKTTLGRALGRTGGDITAGRISVDGTDVLALSPRELRAWRASSLAVVHQEAGAALDPTMRVGAQLAGALRVQGRPRGDVADLLEKVRLPGEAARRYPHQLSGGQRQRVVIAAALAGRPRLLVLDEPTTGLDATVEHEILDLIWALRADIGAAVVLISHDLALVGRLCDDVGVLYAGRLVEEGPAARVLSAPRHPYTKALIDSAPRIGADSVPAAIPGQPPAPGEAPPGCAFAPRCAAADDRCRTVPPGLADGARCHHPGARAVVPVPALPHRRQEVTPLIEVRNLTRAYGRTRVLDDVSLSIGRNEIVGLVGESGSGKTTLARAVAGLGRRGGGVITLDGAELPVEVGRRDPATRRRVSMVFQDSDASLNPSHTVRTILARALGGPERVEELAALAALEPHLLDVRPHRLSGGQKQRVAIARAFAGRPDLIVCDEPVSALDVSVQAGVLRTLADQQALTGVSYLFISHDLAVVCQLADRVAVMSGGRIVEEGPAERILREPRHPYTIGLLRAAGHEPSQRRRHVH